MAHIKNKFAKVYVRNIVSGHDLELTDIFNTCNGFVGINMAPEVKQPWEKATMPSTRKKAQAFVIFDSFKNAKIAVKMFDKRIFNDQPLSVQISRNQQLLSSEQQLIDERYSKSQIKFAKVYVRNIVRGHNSKLKDIFNTCNGLMCIKITNEDKPSWKIQDDTPVTKDNVQAFVTFDSFENASNAVKMFNKRIFMGLPLSVQISRSQELLRTEQQLIDQKHPDRKFPWHDVITNDVVTEPIIPCVPTVVPPVAILVADRFPPINTSVIGEPPGAQYIPNNRRTERTARPSKRQHEAILEAKVVPPRRFKSSLCGVVLDEDPADDELDNRAISQSRVVIPSDKPRSPMSGSLFGPPMSLRSSSPFQHTGSPYGSMNSLATGTLSPASMLMNSSPQPTRGVLAVNQAGKQVMQWNFNLNSTVYKPSDISIKVKNGKLVMTAQHREEQAGRTSQHETTRECDLADSVDVSTINAYFREDNGCLQVEGLLKPEFQTMITDGYQRGTRLQVTKD